MDRFKRRVKGPELVIAILYSKVAFLQLGSCPVNSEASRGKECRKNR